MRASSRKLAIALAERLGEVVPPPLTLGAECGGVSIYADGVLQGGSHAPNLVEVEDGRALAERVALAVEGVLDSIQDCVMEYLHEEWPADGAGKSAPPGARTEGGRAYLWYGASEDDPVIGLPPIEFDELQL